MQLINLLKYSSIFVEYFKNDWLDKFAIYKSAIVTFVIYTI